MHVELTKPELEQFIYAQVKSDCYRTPDAAIEAAVEQMRQSFGDVDQETISAISRADEQYANGDYVDRMAGEYRTRLTRQALNDIEEIREFISVDSEQNAARMIERLFDAFDRWRIFQTGQSLSTFLAT